MARKSAWCEPNYVDTRSIDRNSTGLIEGCGSELASPHLITISIILTDKSIPASCANLAREGTTCIASDVDARSIYRNSTGQITVRGSKLAGPHLITISIILADKGIEAACIVLARQGTICNANNIDTRNIDSYSTDRVT